MAWVDSHAGDSQHRRYYLLEWLIGAATYRWTDCDLPIVTTGSTGAPAATWQPMPFSASGLSTRGAEAVASATIQFGSADGVVSSIVLGSSAGGTPIKVWQAWLDPTAANVISQQEQLVLAGQVDTWELDPAVVSLKTAPLVPLAGLRIPRRIYSTTCSFQFKGPACGYAGAEVECDRSYNRCQALGNFARFGGFTGLQAR